MTTTNSFVSLERLKEKLDYDHVTGLFYWRLKTGTLKLAGSIDNKGYLRISIDKVRYKAHRIAWFYSYGIWPKYQIDHINGCKIDNRLVNLRDVTQTINMYNQKKAHKQNKSNLLGVHKSKSGKYYAKIKVGDKLLHLGTFTSGEEANKKYEERKKQIFKN